jgi:cobalt/nickel transport system permease protein
MALPAVLCYYLFGRMVQKKNSIALFGSFACGVFSVFLGAIMVGLALVFTEENFFKVSSLLVISHLPVMVIEGIITALCVAFLKKVQPTLLPSYSGEKARTEPPSPPPAATSKEVIIDKRRGDVHRR